MNFEFFKSKAPAVEALAPEGIFTAEESESLTLEAKVGKVLDLTGEDIAGMTRSQIMGCVTLLRQGIGRMQDTADSSDAKSHMLAEMNLREIELVNASESLQPENLDPEIEETGAWANPAYRGGDQKGAN